MACGLALAAILLGVGLAEAEHFGPLASGRSDWAGPWIGRAGGCVALAVVFLRAWASRPVDRRAGMQARACGIPPGARRRSGTDSIWCVVGLAVLGFASHERVALRIAQARADEARVWAIEHARSPGSGGRAPRVVEARVASRRDTASGIRCVLTELRDVERAVVLPERVRLLVDREHREGGAAERRFSSLLIPGERVRLLLRFSPVLARRNPGTPDLARALRRRGIGAQARLIDPGLIVAVGAPDGRARRERWRRTIQAATGRRIAGPGAGLARAILLGDRSRLAPRTTEAFRRLGISHLIAISGLHVGLVGGGVVWAVRAGRAFAHRRPAVGAFGGLQLDPMTSVSIAVVVVSGAYAWLVGAAASVQRATLILAFALAIRRFGRPISVFRALSLAAVVMLLVNPELAFDLGARLSFAACLGLGALGRSTNTNEAQGDWMTRSRDALRWSLAAASATAAVWPTGEGGAALWGPIVNVVAIPWLAFAVMPGAIAAALAGWLGASTGVRVALVPAAWMERGARAIADVLQGGAGSAR